MYKVLTIAPTPPKISEVWMTRINDFIMPENMFVSLASSILDSPDSPHGGASLSRTFGMPIKLHLYLFSKAIKARLNRILSESPKDTVVFCHYLTTAVYLWKELKKFNKKIIIHCHGHDVTWDRRIEGLPFFRAHGFFYVARAKKLIGKVTLIANSTCTKKKLIDIGFPEADIIVNHLSVNTDELKPTRKPESDKVNILYLGRLTDFKGPIETIKAFEIARSKGLKGDLHLVGGGTLKKACAKLVAKSTFKESIHLYGSVERDRAMEFFGSADIFTAHNKKSEKTKQEEAFGVSIIEAMSFGIPVVTGRSAGVTETIVDKKTGFLIPTGDIEAHANALLRLWSDPKLRIKMGAKGRKRAIEHFDSKRDKLRLRAILGI
ncbi:glycosyltransferase family 4 protein [uncultured Microbulbifer sp.]|uniref:glycosyltransferase family 4 protein n=1 Tax=uncultured Microbulbifer sp. TaxID=348147 RepID=UPI00261BE9D3|nr:glycosyltransferase family 4 protein [uncultured Microbulbifer sp.]